MAIILISDSPDTDEAVRLSDITVHKIYSQSTLALARVSADDLRENLERHLEDEDLDKLKSLSSEQIYSIMHEIGDYGFGTSACMEMEQAGIDELTDAWLDNLAEWEEKQTWMKKKNNPLDLK